MKDDPFALIVFGKSIRRSTLNKLFMLLASCALGVLIVLWLSG